MRGSHSLNTAEMHLSVDDVETLILPLLTWTETIGFLPPSILHTNDSLKKQRVDTPQLAIT